MLDATTSQYNAVSPPKMQILDFNFPEELKQQSQFFAWGWVKGKKKFEKRPYRIGGGLASSTDPGCQTSFEHALRYIRNFEITAPDVHRGLGFVFTKDDPYVGIDLDDCVDPETGVIADWARDVLIRLNSYSEISPSGTGVKIWIRGKKPEWSRNANHDAGVEVFEHSRFFTATGHIVAGMPREIRECQDELEWLCEKYLKNGSTRKSNGPVSRPSRPRHEIADAFAEREDVISALNALSPSRAENYTEWLEIGMALHSFDESLLPEWDFWSSQSSKYDPQICDRKWSSFTSSGGTSIGTLFYYAEQDGWVRPFRRDPNSRPESGPMFLDATKWEPLAEFAGETVFLPDMLTRRESGDPENHTSACSCDSCSAKARTAEARDREKRKSCRNNFFLTNGDNTFFARLPCMNWDCSHCRKTKLIPKWEDHLVEVINAEESVHVGVVDHCEWTKVTRRIRRRKGSYVRILSAENGVLIIADTKFTGSQVMDSESATEILKAWTNVLKYYPPGIKAKKKNERPFSTSKYWKPLKEPPRDNGYKRVDMPRAADKTIKKALSEFRIGFQTLERAGSGQVTFARLELPSEFYGDGLQLLKQVASRVADIVSPDSERWSRDHNGSETDNNFVTNNEFEDDWGSLDNYPQDPLFASPPDF